MATPEIITLSTENPTVARIMAAHNVAAYLIQQWTSESQNEAADAYVQVFNRVYTGLHGETEANARPL
jgi:hypothetical protein